MTTRFYAADLAAYNAGRLHGVWVDASSDVEAMQEAIDAMLAKSPVDGAEEWLIHDYDDELRAISHIGETSDLNAIAEVMEAVESIESDYPEKVLPLLIEWVSDRAAPDEWADTLSDAYRGEWESPEDYAAELAEDCGYLEQVPDALQFYIDFKGFARDMALNGEVDFLCVSTGDYLQSYDQMAIGLCVALANV